MVIDWRAHLEAALGRSLPDEAWTYLKGQGYISELEAQPDHLERIVRQVRALLRAFGTRPTSKMRMLAKRGAPEMTRAEGVSRILAASAEQDEQVRQFRSDVLNGRLLKLADVENWIQERAAAEGADVLYEVVLPPGVAVRRSRSLLIFEPPIQEARHVTARAPTLEYPKDGWTGRVRIRVGGTLGALDALSKSLASAFGWQSGQATAFVLTGAVPLLDDVRAEHSKNWSTGAYRVRLDLDPRVSPRELGETYGRIRRGAVGKRHRDLSAKHLRLAVFLAERNVAENWPARMTAWNADIGRKRGWNYTRASNFARDARRAFSRAATPSSR